MVPDQLKIIPLRLAELRKRGLYWRPTDPLASTEFTYSRFLVPYLAGYCGWVLYLDLDMLVRRDVGGLFALRDARFAVMVVKHVHRPREVRKMDGRPQSSYPRKNWSSVMLFNASECCGLTPAAVNDQPASWLHRFAWLPDERIGSLPESWNWLDGHSDSRIDPAIVHYTSGGPWFEAYQDAAFAAEWRAVENRLSAIRR